MFREPRPALKAVLTRNDKLGVREGAGYAGIAGWMETKLGSYRVQEQVVRRQGESCRFEAPGPSASQNADGVAAFARPHWHRRFFDL